MKIKFELNGKALLGIALLSAGIAFGEYVSVINAKSSGGIVVSQPESSVGTVVLRMDDVNPSTIYGGTWELVRSDGYLAFGDGSVQSGVPTGNNMVSVPLLAHSHTASFSGNALPNHSHLTYANGSDSDQHPGGGNYISGSSFWHGKSSHSGQSTQAVSAGTPTGSVSVNTTGQSDAKMDVRGERLYINVWKRIA